MHLYKYTCVYECVCVRAVYSADHVQHIPHRTVYKRTYLVSTNCICCGQYDQQEGLAYNDC